MDDLPQHISHFHSRETITAIDMAGKETGVGVSSAAINLVKKEEEECGGGDAPETEDATGAPINLSVR